MKFPSPGGPSSVARYCGGWRGARPARHREHELAQARRAGAGEKGAGFLLIDSKPHYLQSERVPKVGSDPTRTDRQHVDSLLSSLRVF